MSDDPRLAFLAKYKADGLPAGYGDVVLMFVGKDDCHGALLEAIPMCKQIYRENMYSYDDAELNKAIVTLMHNVAIKVQLTLDRSQSSNKTETAILAFDKANDPTAYQNDVAIGESDTHQISHTKGGVIDDWLFFEGSMNWSSGGEGTGIVLNGKQIVGFKAQNNTLLFSTNQVALQEFAKELDKEHQIVLDQTKTT